MNITAQIQSFFSLNGRIGRGQLVVNMIILILPGLLGLLLPSEPANSFEYLAFIVLGIAIGVLAVFQIVKRLHDVDLSGWLWVLCYIPVTTIPAMLYIFFKSGTPGPNKYGDPPGTF